jgi:excisionase family DNA binding protein
LGKTLDAKERTMTDTIVGADDELPRRLLNITELAEFLGVNTRHVRRLVAERRIPFIKWGHLIRFDPIEVVRWLDGHRRRPERSA